MSNTQIWFGSDDKHKPYRCSVGLFIFNKRGEVLMAERMPTLKGLPGWQMPQGGIDKGEAAETALFREAVEEVGLESDKLRLVGRYPQPVFYDYPDYRQSCCAPQGNAEKYRGQKQEWFALEFLGEDKDIDISGARNKEGAEFRTWTWMDADHAITQTVSFRQQIYRQLVDYFRPAMMPQTQQERKLQLLVLSLS